MQAWLAARTPEFRERIEVVLIDPHAGYAAAVRAALPDAAIAVDHFHLIMLANKAVTAVRQRVTRELLGRRGRKTRSGVRPCGGSPGVVALLPSRPCAHLRQCHGPRGRDRPPQGPAARLGCGRAAVATAVLLALLTAALVAGWGGGPAAGYGSAAFGAAGLAVGLLVLARAGAVARTDAARGRALCNRCCVWALFAVLPVFIVGGVAGYLTRAAAPIWGSTVAGVLLIALVGLAARQRVVLEVRAAW